MIDARLSVDDTSERISRHGGWWEMMRSLLIRESYIPDKRTVRGPDGNSRARMGSFALFYICNNIDVQQEWCYDTGVQLVEQTEAHVVVGLLLG